jgi:hypothetical protein
LFVAKVAKEVKVLDEISGLVGLIGLEIVLLSLLRSALTVVVKDYPLVVAHDQLIVGYRKHNDG